MRRQLLDLVLAIVLAIVAVGLAESGRQVAESSGPAVSWSMNSPPDDARPGAIWNARLTVFDEGRPASSTGRALPLLTVQSARTGKWTTVVARPAGAPGFYRARVVLRDGGHYLYSVLLDDPGEPPAPAEATRPGVVILTLLATLPIALRRRFPLPVLGVTLAAALAADLRLRRFAFPGPLVALYTVGRLRRPAALAVRGGGHGRRARAPGARRSTRSGSGSCWRSYALFGAAWLLGDNVRTRRERARRVEAEQQANVRRAAAEEQARIARELHDVIGHSVSVMTIQAAAAGDAFDSRPAEVREALRAIESTGREALAELRRLLAGESGLVRPRPRPRRASARSPTASAVRGPRRRAVTPSRRRCRRASTSRRTGSCRRH